MDKIQVSVLGQDASFSAQTALERTFSDGLNHLSVSTAEGDPHLMISIGGPRPRKTPKMIPVPPPFGLPTLTPGVPNAVIISFEDHVPDIRHEPGQNLIAISIGGPRPPRAPGGDVLVVCLDTTQGTWDVREDPVSRQLIASFHPPPQKLGADVTLPTLVQ